MDKNESVLTTLNSSHTLDDAHDFQQRFNNRKIGREAFPNKNVPWPGDDDVKVLTNLLEGIDPGFSIDIRTWGQFKSNMPILYEWFQTHVLFRDYLTKIVTCNKTHPYRSAIRMFIL